MPPRLTDVRALDDREQKLDELLSRWQEAQDPIFGRTGGGDGEPGLSLMPLTWNMSYRKLEVLVRYMADVADTGSADFRSTYCHMRQWYWRGEWRRAKVRERDQVSKKFRETERMVFHPGRSADARFVLRGLEWISGHFPGEIYLPREFVEAA